MKASSEEIYGKSTQGTMEHAEKYIQWVTSCRWRYGHLHSFNCCCVPNRRNAAKFAENSNLYSSGSSKVIDLGVYRKRTCNFLLVINSNFGLSVQFSRYW